MASYEDLKLPVRLFMNTYPFSRFALNPIPCAPLRKPLRGSHVALVTTAGLHTPAQPAFDSSIRRGDSSFREIPDSVDPQSLLESHKSDAFDHAGIQADRNVAFPLDRFHELALRGEIGSLNQRHFSFMGSIIEPGHLTGVTAPQVARLLAMDGVEVVFLTPV
jgi:D-proline reductase (dithiol) PrdB